MRPALAPDLAKVLAQPPSPETWVELWRSLCTPRPDLLAQVRLVAGALRAWPPEVERAEPPLPRPPHPAYLDHATDEEAAQRRKLCRRVREVDLYRLYVEGVCASPELRLGDGRQAVHLQRYFVGTLQSAGADVRVGERGTADLVGHLCVELPRAATQARLFGALDLPPVAEPAAGVRSLPAGAGLPSDYPAAAAGVLAVYLEVEVKRDAGAWPAHQRQRCGAVRSRGGVYVLARRVQEAVSQVAAEKARIEAALAAGQA